MKILISGDRNWTDKIIVEAVIRGVSEMFWGTEIVEGCAKGADHKAELAVENIRDDCGGDGRVFVDHHPADWEKYGKGAGPVRNQEMLETDPNVVIAFHNDISASKGTKDMINRSLNEGKLVFHIREVKEEIE